MTLSLQLLWNYWSIYHKTWYVGHHYGVMHISRKFWSLHFCGSYAPWNLENIRKLTNNLSFLCQFFINEITASDAGPDIIRSHLFLFLSKFVCLPSQDICVFSDFEWNHVSALVYGVLAYPSFLYVFFHVIYEPRKFFVLYTYSHSLHKQGTLLLGTCIRNTWFSMLAFSP